MATVINLRHGRQVLKEPDVVRIDRATQWGNPFRIGQDGSREDVIAQYRVYLWRAIRSGEIERAELAALKDKRLACHCFPRPCHGDVLARAAAWAASVSGTAEPVPGFAEPLLIPGDDIIGRVSFKPINSEEARIYDDEGDWVGEVYRQPDILNPGEHYFLVWLESDPRGPARVHDRARIRDVAEERVRTHPLFP